MTDEIDEMDYSELDDHNKLMQKLTEVVEAAEELFNKYNPETTISVHNTSQTAHSDIRNSVSGVQTSVNNLKNTFDTTIESVKLDYSEKITKIETTINTLVSSDGGVAYASKAKYNNSGYELSDNILTDVEYNTATNVVSLTKISGTKTSFKLTEATTSTNGLMTSTDKSNLSSAITDISSIQIGIQQISDKQKPVTDDEITDMAKAAWNDTEPASWIQSGYIPWKNTNE